MVTEELPKECQKENCHLKQFWDVFFLGGTYVTVIFSSSFVSPATGNWKLRLVDLPSTATLGFGLNPVAELIPVAAANPMP